MEETNAITEPTLFYDPPYERPLEDEFAWHLVRYLNPGTKLSYQALVETQAGKFWTDFVVEFASRRIGFELGNITETTDPEEVKLRDVYVLSTGAFDVLYRLRGSDVLHRLHDCLNLVARFEPELFSNRGHVNLNTLVSPECAAKVPGPSDSEIRVEYPPAPISDEYEGEIFEWPSDAPDDLIVRRLSRTTPGAWIRDYDRTLHHYGVSVDVQTTA